METSKSSVLKGAKQSGKKQTCQESSRKKAATTAQNNEKDKGSLASTADIFIPSTSTPEKSNEESKEIARNTPADKKLETFQSRDITTKEWNKLADQVLRRGVQKAAEDILKSTDREGEIDKNAPTPSPPPPPPPEDFRISNCSE